MLWTDEIILKFILENTQLYNIFVGNGIRGCQISIFFELRTSDQIETCTIMVISSQYTVRHHENLRNFIS